jgi:lysophospholipase L1-like esterase
MPLGDSITQGNTRVNSYRRSLWQLFANAGLRADFVGSETDNHEGRPPDPDFDLDHEGHWGWRADEIDAQIDAWARAHRPDLVLVHLGTNDVFDGEDNASTIVELRAIVSKLRAVNPRVSVLLAQIISVTPAAPNRQILDLNRRIRDLGPLLTTPESPVVIVDQHTGFDAERDTFDGVHPNAEGEAKMAAAWFAACRALAARSLGNRLGPQQTLGRLVTRGSDSRQK